MNPMRKTHLRSRVFLITALYALVLFAVTIGLSWRARVTQERWSRLMRVETEAISGLDALMRSQNGFRNRLEGMLRAGEPPADAVARYVTVKQLLHTPALEAIDKGLLVARVRAYESLLADLPQALAESGTPSALRDLGVASAAINHEAQRIVTTRKREIDRQLPALERDTHDMMLSGLAVTYMLAIFSFAVARLTLAKVVKPIEELSAAASRIAAGDLTARAPVGGDHEIAQLGGAFNRMAAALAASHAELAERARTDDLTGMPNFRAFRERIDEEIRRADRYPELFGVLVLDLDRFKKYNDSFGHLAGNEALQRVAAVLRDTVRGVDFAARYGGEEFAVIVPEIEPDALLAIAERVRAGVESLPALPGTSRITISIGAALFPADGKTPEELFQTADVRLYEAKEQGRNRVVGPALKSRMLNAER
jgi:diguanylate cyclase (GGDEF)-like protein